MAEDLPLNGLTVLLVEDQTLIALDAEDMLREQGAALVMTYATQADALEYLSANRPDAAVLDVSLGNETSLDVAARLSDLAIPFIIATGYGEDPMIRNGFQNALKVAKPYRAEALTEALRGVIGSRQSSSRGAA